METNTEKLQTMAGHGKTRPKHTGTKRLFENPILEALSRTHIMVPVTMWLTLSVFLGWYSFTYTNMSTGTIASLFGAGLFVFTLFEYVLHRYLYHLAPTTPQRAKIQYTFHGVHHEYPKDKTRLALPPALAIIIAGAFFGLFFLMMGEAAYAFFPGFLVGYTGYLSVHFIVHAYSPPKNFFKYMWVNHSVHHYKNPESNYGVSTPIWDHVFKSFQK